MKTLILLVAIGTTGLAAGVPTYNKDIAPILYQNCAGCHGADGKLGPAPPLNDKLFLALIADAELQRVITEGRPGTLMPAFATAKGGTLTAEQLSVLADGIKSRWGSVESAPSGAPPLLGKFVSIAFNVPIGFFGHRYLTFGRGISATLKEAFRRR